MTLSAPEKKFHGKGDKPKSYFDKWDSEKSYQTETFLH
jgi:hypothetical protein